MAVRQRGDSWQADFYANNKRIRKDFASRELAITFEKQVLDLVERGEEVPTESVKELATAHTMQELFDICYTQFWAKAKAERTSRKNGEDIVKAFGKGTNPALLDEGRIDKQCDEWAAKGFSNSTINRKLAGLSVMLRMAYRRGWIKRRPELSRRKESKGRIRFYTPKEEEAILGRFKFRGYAEMHDYVLLLIDTGLRRSEGLLLRWSEVRDGRVTVVEGKTTAAARTIKLTDRCVTMLKERAKNVGQGAHSDAVFPNLTENSVEHLWVKIRDDLGFAADREFVIHTCRHTFASRMVMAGVDLVTLKYLMGHASLAMVQRYAHLNGAHADLAITKMQNFRSTHIRVDTVPKVRDQPVPLLDSHTDTGASVN